MVVVYRKGRHLIDYRKRETKHVTHAPPASCGSGGSHKQAAIAVASDFEKRRSDRVRGGGTRVWRQSARNGRFPEDRSVRKTSLEASIVAKSKEKRADGLMLDKQEVIVCRLTVLHLPVRG